MNMELTKKKNSNKIVKTTSKLNNEASIKDSVQTEENKKINKVKPMKCFSAERRDVLNNDDVRKFKRNSTQIILKDVTTVNPAAIIPDAKKTAKDILKMEQNSDKMPLITVHKSMADLNDNEDNEQFENEKEFIEIPEKLRKQGSASNCSSKFEDQCPCSTTENEVNPMPETKVKQFGYCNRKSWISVERITELRRNAQEALKTNKTFTIRGCFYSVRNALTARGWVEKLDIHRKNTPNGVCQVTYEDIQQALPKRRPGETRRQYLNKCERNIMSRFLEHMPINFLWTARKEKCDYTDQTKNPSMTINKFARVPFTSKEGLCNQLKDFHWFYEEGITDLHFPRCYNVWSPEELNEFIDNFRMTACISFLKWIVDKFKDLYYDGLFAINGRIPFNSIEFAIKRCSEYLDSCLHNDIDINVMEQPKIWEHDWDTFLKHHFMITHENARITFDQHTKLVDTTMQNCQQILEKIIEYWPQYNLDGYLNLWIIKPANKCRGRGIHLINNLKKIINIINPAIASKSRYVIQKYIERPLIIHNTKFDIRQWFMITNVQPMVIWMYKESYLRFSSQEFNLNNHHESIHLTNHAVQKKYRNGKRDKRLPNENMWDCYSFQAYLRQIGEHRKWSDRIYPGMCKAIIGTMLASQEQMDRRANTFELFGADFMITEDFFPWLIEINSSPDLGATTSVTARMCPQCLEDAIKVVIDKRHDPKADTGNFELIYRQIMPPTPAYMGLNLFLKGKQIQPKTNHFHSVPHNTNHNNYQLQRMRTERLTTSVQKQLMPTVYFHGGPCYNNLQNGNQQQQSLISPSRYPQTGKLSNYESNESNLNAIQLDNSPGIQSRKSSINSTKSSQFLKDNTQYFQSNRLLTPFLNRNHHGSTGQLIVSPRVALFNNLRSSSENISTKNETINKIKPKLISTKIFNAMHRRPVTCDPRLRTRPLIQSTLSKNKENVMENEQKTMIPSSKPSSTNPILNNSTMEKCEKMLEIMYKTKNPFKLNQLDKPPSKVKPTKMSTKNMNCNSAKLLPKMVANRKNCILHKKNVHNNCDYGIDVLDKKFCGNNKMSFRVWRSKQLRKCSCINQFIADDFEDNRKKNTNLYKKREIT